jgi:hypothetical protein
MAIEVFCVAAGHPCCFVYVPEDKTDASYRMLAGLHMKVPNKPVMAVAVTHPLFWASLRLLVGTPNNAWIHDLPGRADAERVVEVRGDG